MFSMILNAQAVWDALKPRSCDTHSMSYSATRETFLKLLRPGVDYREAFHKVTRRGSDDARGLGGARGGMLFGPGGHMSPCRSLCFCVFAATSSSVLHVCPREEDGHLLISKLRTQVSCTHTRYGTGVCRTQKTSVYKVLSVHCATAGF